MTLKDIIILDRFCTWWPFPCLDYWLPLLLISMSVTREVVARGHDDNWDQNHNQWVFCACLYGGHSGRWGGGSSQLSQGLLIDWCLMRDDWCVFRLSRAEARPGFSRLSQCYSFIKAESYSGHRSWQWQTNIMSGRVDNDVMNVRVTGWRGINICKAAGGWWEIAVMAGFFFPPLMRPWLYGLALMHCNIVKHPQNRWMWYVNYVSRESQFPDRRVVFDCDPFFIITFRDRSTNHLSVVMWTLICLQSSDSLIFTHFFFFLLFFLSPHLSVSANLLTRSLIITQHW